MIDNKDNLSYLYREYERLHGVVNEYSHSSFDDFKLLGALGIVFAWDPVLSLMIGPNKSASQAGMLFIGFVVALAISAIVSVRDILKQSLMIFNHQLLSAYECELRILLKQENKGTFCGSKKWTLWFKQIHGYVALSFYGLYSSIIIFFPAVILFFQASIRYAIGYLLISVLISIFPATAFYRLYKRSASFSFCIGRSENSGGTILNSSPQL